MSVPRLLALLAASVEQTTSTGGANRKRGKSSWGIEDIATTQALASSNLSSSSSAAATGSSSGLRIRSLRRVYNILLFGGPSHAEIIAQAAFEDENDTNSRGATAYGWGGVAAAGRDESGSNSNDDALASVSASVSAVSLELRQGRRYDPANALEGLVEDLLAVSNSRGGEGQAEGAGGASSVARVLRLLTALKGHGGQVRDTDDWELVGGHGRRVLERLYNNLGENPRRPEQQQQQQKSATTASLPVAMFFRDGQRVNIIDVPLRPARQLPEAGSTLPPKVPRMMPLDSVNTAPAVQRQQQQQRYLLPDDCVLHGDSTATATALSSKPSSAAATHSGLGTMEHIPWFTDAEFASERGIPDMNKGSSLDECLEAMATAPLSPAAWTRLRLDGNGARSCGDEAIPPFLKAARGSGGAPAASAAAAVGLSEGRRGGRAQAAAKQAARHYSRGGAPPGHDDLGLCGALSQARVDPRSPAVRELRLALSFPDIVEGRPTNLLEAVQQQQPVRLADRSVSASYSSGAGGNGANSSTLRGVVLGGAPWIEVPRSNAVQQSLRRSPRPSGGERANGSSPADAFAPPWGGHTGGHLKGVATHSCSTCEPAVAPALEPVGWERTEAHWNDPSFPKWALACSPLATAEGGQPASDRAFELCYREHFGGVGSGGYSEEPPAAAAEAEVVRRALAVLQGVPSENFWYDENYARMRVSGRQGGEAAGPGGERNTEEKAMLGFPRRVPGLSHGTLLSLLEEFARAGTWYRRVEEFASCLVDRSSKPGQVAHAFGVELRRQLTVIQSALLEMTTEFAGVRLDDDSDSSCVSSVRDNVPHTSRCCSLTGVLVRTTQLRRAVGALAEICGLMEENLGRSGGVWAAFRAFPRGASLLTYLYNAAEVRVASKPGGGEGEEEGVGTVGGVMEDKDSALALLSCSAAPYLAMLGRWLWSGEMRSEDDPYEEFPLRCRERLADIAHPIDYGRGGDSQAAKEAWMEDGGGSFMTLAFRENEGAGVPCFLEGGVLAAAARAGKLLRMLKLASPEFYAACSASPPPPLSLVFKPAALASRAAVFERLRLLRVAAGRSAACESRARAAEKEVRKGMASGAGGQRLLAGEEKALGKLKLQRERERASVTEARRIWAQGLEGDRAAAAATAIAAANNTAAAAAASEKPLSVAASSERGGRGGLSFLDPPTSEAEAFAAAAITERYRLLGQEADVRAARARWKRKRSARAVTTRASLKVLYAEEAHVWKGMAAEASRAVVGEGGDTTAGTEVAVDGNADSIIPRSVETTPVASLSDGPDGGGSDGDGEQIGRVAEKPEAQGEGNVYDDDEGYVDADDGNGGGMKLEAELGAENTIVQSGPVVPDPSDKEYSEDVKFSPVNIVDEPGGKSAGVSAALGGPTDDTRGVKFSHVNIVQDPGGKSCGVSRALGTDVNSDGASGGGDGTATVGSLGERPDFERPVRETGVYPNALSSVTSHDSSVAIDGVSTVGGAAKEERQAHDHGSNVDSSRQAAIGPGENWLDVSLSALQGATVVAPAAGDGTDRRSRSRKNSQDAPSLGVLPKLTAMTAAEGRPRATGGSGSDVAGNREVLRKRPKGESFRAEHKEKRGVAGRAAGSSACLPLEVMVRRCVREPVLTQCSAVDSAALAFLVRDAGMAEHLASLRTFLLGLSSDFLHDFTLRLLDGLYDGGVDWRRPSNLDAAFAASASATGLDSAPLAETFRYEVDPTCGGLLGPRPAQSFPGIGSREESSGSGGGGVAAPHSAATNTDAHVSLLPSPSSSSSSPLSNEDDLYSPVALSFVSPVFEVEWPVGVLLPTGVLHTYGGIHRLLFRHQLALHRLRRLRVALRELGAWIYASSGGGGGGGGRGRSPAMGRRRGRGGGGGSSSSSSSSSDRQYAAGVSWDRGRLHWLHLFRHEMQHMADSLQTFFAEQAETGWPDLRRSLAVAGGGEGRGLKGGRGGGLAALVTAHSCYIAKMRRHMFLGNDRQGAVARGRIGEFYEVLCAVGRITDSLLSLSPSSEPPSPSPAAAGDDGVCSSNPGEEKEMDLRASSGGRGGSGRQQQQRDEAEDKMVLPDQAFAELATTRERFDAARRGLCEALSEICAAGGGARARPLLATLGYGGYIPV